MDLRMFSEGWFSKPTEEKPVAQSPAKSKVVNHQADIDAFHTKHKELEEIAKRLHASGHHITIDYKSPNVVRHGKESGTHFVNSGLNTEKKIQITRKVPLRPWK